jgi:hypothetical protein
MVGPLLKRGESPESPCVGQSGSDRKEMVALSVSRILLFRKKKH